MRIILFFYDILFILGFIVYLPFYIYQKKINLCALKEKLGFILPLRRAKNEGCVWIQAVSVGEAHLVGVLIKEWVKISRVPLVISTTTLTGNTIARRKYSSFLDVFFFPLDVSFIIKKIVKIVRPKVFVAVETEIWPNLFYYLKKKNIPIVIINGRISRKAFRRYKIIKPFIKMILNKCEFIGVQNHSYKERFLSLGCNPAKLIIAGNMKFETIEVNEDIYREIRNTYLPFLKKDNNMIIIAASTHHPEEEMIIDIYKSIIEVEKKVTLIIAPRHTERILAIEKIIVSKGFTPFRISGLNRYTADKRNVFLLDTIGKLLYFYAISDICFVGGSIARYGGHNILEPIYFRKPVCFGPFMDNFKDIEEIVLANGAGIKVNSKEQLQETLWRLVKDDVLRNNLVSGCEKVFQEERSSLKNNLQIILKSLK
jgi:3-deoxy-D-manno-octulosonic-acid transferase